MLDIQFIKNNKKAVNKAILDKGIKLNLDYLLDLDTKRRTLKQEVDELRQKRNEIAAKLKATGKNDKLIENGREVKKLLSELEEKYRAVKDEYDRLLWYVPQIPSEDTPVGKSDKENKVIEEGGVKPTFDFEPKDHIELGKGLDILDLERGTKVSGFRGYFLKNEGVMLHLGVLMFAVEKMREKGFTLMVPPTLTKDFALYGTGWFPFDMDNVYKAIPAGKLKLEDEKAEGTNLVGTAEVSLLGYYADEILSEADLPIKVCGLSQCYRSEVGSYRKDTKGIYRIREFAKVEQVVICRDSEKEANKIHEELLEISKEMLTDLELPFRVVIACTGDMGAGKYKMYDIETWMPARGDYGETHSDSSLKDWQARRMNIKYKNKEGENKYVYTLNNTAIASPRILIAILENNQDKEGNVHIPKVLQKYVGKDILKKN
ncbi:MAG: serine--tRNA ligase [Candidatus Dojkabacteria bacterium]|nr:serine--tRNA ligase [Candidatus Dojkabacteria bacterium]